MSEHLVTFLSPAASVHVPTGTLLSDAARLAGVDVGRPCGDQGRCGRCAVQVKSGQVRRRSTMRLTKEDIAAGWALACQTVVEGDVILTVPPQEKIERHLTMDRTVADVAVPAGYDPQRCQTVRRLALTLPAPTMDDQTDDVSRLQTALRAQAGLKDVVFSLSLLRRLGAALRGGSNAEDAPEWLVSAVVEAPPADEPGLARLIDLQPGHAASTAPLWGAAIDIGTTTVTLWLVDLISGQVRAQVSEYNAQIQRGEDVISRIVYSGKGNGADELRSLVLGNINTLLHTACRKTRASVQPTDIMKVNIAGNPTMLHLLLGVPAAPIRMAPFVTTFNQTPPLTGRDLGLDVFPDAVVDCLPGVASYVGADITAGVLACDLDQTEGLTLFMDVGTNGEIVLGSREFLITCACSAGPAFEGAGVVDGMRATRGAIEEVWINQDNFEPVLRVIGNVQPKGICGSGLISLLAEMFTTGLVDKAGHINTNAPSPRVRIGDHGAEYVVAWGKQTASGKDIAITAVDIDNLIRAKAAIYAGYTVMADQVGIPLESVERMLIGGSFGKYINVEKAVQIGLLPDLPWEQFEFLGNTSVKGTYLALLDSAARKRLQTIAASMTYLELSAGNSFYDAFMSALFLPHTDLSRFPSVAGSKALV